MTSNSVHSGHRSSRWATITLGLATIASALVLVAAPANASAAGEPAAEDWLGTVNVFRAQSGLAPVVNNNAWSAGARNHSCWMLLNGIAHDEVPGTPGYSTEGDQAGNNGNVAVSSNSSATARSHINLWMSGPFHAIGILRPSLTQAAFGKCSSPPNPTNTRWKSAATLDVIRGNTGGAAKPSTPIVFPGNGSTTSMTRFVAESPDPRTFCGWSGQRVGLPLIALMPSTVTSANATLTGPNGPIPTCVLTQSNTSGIARSVLAGDNAVVVVPAAPLATGAYSVSVGSNGGAANWTFNVDPTAPLTVAPAAPPKPLATTAALTEQMSFQPVTPFRFADSRTNTSVSRLPANRQVRVKLAGQRGLPANITAISANFTTVGASHAGYLTASNCAESKPSFSTLNYSAQDGVPNQAIIPLDRGDVCLYSSQSTDIVIDINGYVSPDASQVFNPVAPSRLLDTRNGGQILRRGEVLRVKVEGGASPAPGDAVAVALNLTAPLPTRDGWIRAFPCDVSEPTVSSINPRYGEVLANSVIVPTSDDGTVCLTSSMTSHVVIDITGWFGPSDGQRFVPIRPVRLADTREAHPELNGGNGPFMLAPGKTLKVQVAGNRGIDPKARAASLNLVSVGAPSPGFLTVLPCGQRDGTSNLNFSGGGTAVANGTNVMLDESGAVCVTSMVLTHVVVDITGLWR